MQFYDWLESVKDPRDWLKANPDSDYELPQDIIDKTIAKYKEAYEMLTGEKFHR